MVDFDEAKAIAAEVSDQLTHCSEYAKAYVFSNAEESVGGLGPLVVTKDDGSKLEFVFALTNGRLGDFVRAYDD